MKATSRRLRGDCPTCGSHDRDRRGHAPGPTRIRRGKVRVTQDPRGPFPGSLHDTSHRSGLQSTRLYGYSPRRLGSWRRTYALCNDLWHDEPEPEPATAPTNVNKHAPKQELSIRRKLRARRHRDHQSKDKR